MNTILLLVSIIIFAALSLRIGKWLSPPYRAVLFCALLAFFGVMALVDRDYRYPHLFFAVLSAVQVVRVLYTRTNPSGQSD